MLIKYANEMLIKELRDWKILFPQPLNSLGSTILSTDET